MRIRPFLLVVVALGASATAAPITSNDHIVVCIKASKMGSPVTGSASAWGELHKHDGTTHTVTANLTLDRIDGTNGIGCTEPALPDAALLREVREVGMARLTVQGIEGSARSDLKLATSEARIGRDGSLQVVITIEFQFQPERGRTEIEGFPAHSERRQGSAVFVGGSVAGDGSTGGGSAIIGR